MDKKKMPHESLSFIQRLQEYGFWGYLWLFGLSIFAGAAEYAEKLKKSGAKFTFRGLMLHITAPAFVGLVTGFLCHYFEFNNNLTSALVGVSAYNGTKSIDFITEIIKKKISSMKK